MIETINHLGHLVLNFFSTTLLMNSAFLIAVLSAIVLLKKSSARARYNIGLLGLLKLVLPPFIAFPIAVPALRRISAASLSTDMLTNSSPVNPPVLAPTLDFIGMLFLFWIICCILILCIVLARAVRFFGMTRAKKFIRAIQYRGKNIPLYECGNIHIPMTIGLFSKKIIVPSVWFSWSNDSRQLVLDHEMAHIKRHDGLVQTLQIVLQALYFFHPLVWLLNRQLNELREMACDDMSTKSKSSSLLFSRCLVEIAEDMVRASVSHPSVPALIRQKKHLVKRVKYQLEESTMKTNKSFLLASSVTIALLFFASSLTFTQVTGAPPDAAKDSTLSIRIASDGKIRLNGQDSSIDNLALQINTAVEKQNHLKYVHFSVEPDTPMGVVQDVKKILQEVALLNVTYRMFDGEELKMVLPHKDSHEQFAKIAAKNKCLILINSAGKMMVDEEPRNHSEMKDHVKRRLAENPNLVIDVTVMPQAPAEHLITVLKELKQLGAKRISTGAQKKRQSAVE